MEKPTAVRFVTSHMPYRAGEIAGFPLAEAKHLCETLKVAELVEKAAGKGEKPKDEPPQGGETQKGEQKPQGGETQKGEQKPQGGEKAKDGPK